jgi:hypothetical protein
MSLRRSTAIRSQQELMRALTIRQPWAWAIAFAGKNVENRDWTTAYRGELAIHAGLGLDPLEYFPRGVQRPTSDELARGAFIALADLIDIREHVRSKWFFGRYGWILDNIRPLRNPVPSRGQLRLWAPTAEQIRRIRQQL